MPLEGRRATDYDADGRNIMSAADKRAMKRSIPLWKRPIYCIFQERTMLVVAAVAAIAIGAISLKKNSDTSKKTDQSARQTATRNMQRDEARKYQACVQRDSQAGAQNSAFRVLRSALLTSRHRMLLQVQRTNDPVLRRKYRSDAKKFLADRSAITFATRPDCERTYPTGFKASPKFPDLAPVKAPMADR